MAYTIRPATIADIPHIVQHRELMFREMGIPAEFEDMKVATELWLRHAIPSELTRSGNDRPSLQCCGKAR